MIFVNPSSQSNTDIPNLALAYAATATNTKIIDFNTMPTPFSRLWENETDTLGISYQSRSASEAQKIKEAFAQHYPHSRIVSVSGFLDIQCCYPYLRFDDNIDYTMDFSDSLPFPNYELFDTFSIFQKNWQSGTWPYPIMTSRGCPFSCTYCQSRQRNWFPRSAQHCIDELIEAKRKWGIKTFTILDDCFNLKKDRALEFCARIKELNLEWMCTNGLRADRLDNELAAAMAHSGCTTVGFGIESSDPAVLLKIQKGETIDQIESAITIAKKHFKSVSGYFIIGLPGSTYQSDMQSIRWAIKQPIYMNHSFYTPFTAQSAENHVFYGDNAEPLGDIYPKVQQKKLYELTRGFSFGGSNRKLFKIFLNRIRLFTHFGPSAFISYMSLDMKKIMNRIHRTFV